MYDFAYTIFFPLGEEVKLNRESVCNRRGKVLVGSYEQRSVSKRRYSAVLRFYAYVCAESVRGRPGGLGSGRLGLGLGEGGKDGRKRP